MNDIVLKGTSIKKELLIFLIVFTAVFAVNIYSIIAYKTPWSEVISSLGFVIIFALVLYLLVFVVRLIIKTLIRLIK